jgi:hypothetical protein
MILTRYNSNTERPAIKTKPTKKTKINFNKKIILV